MTDARDGTSGERPDKLIGLRLGKDDRLEVRRKLGSGGIGAVYEAWDHPKARSVAVKFLRTDRPLDDELIRRFMREGRRFGGLQHPNIVRIHGLGRKDNLLFIASEYVEGKNLAQRLATRGACEVEEALGFCRDIATGLAFAHSLKIVHRDMKPENVMIRDSDGVLKIVDFGIAKVMDSASIQTHGGKFLGTPGYAAPEQVKGQTVDHRADIFALGTILYELLTNKYAIPGKRTTQILNATLARNVMPASSFNDKVVGPVADLIVHMIQRRPVRRPESMTDVIQAIDEVEASLDAGFGTDERSGIRGLLKRLFEPRSG